MRQLVVNPAGRLGSGQMVISQDGQPTTPRYSVQQTYIDGKKTLILDHADLARLLQNNGNNATAVVLQTGSNITQVNEQ